jgi:hypothetical protein
MLDTVPGGVVLRCTAGDLDGPVQFLIGFGRPFPVRRPPEQVAALEQLAVGIAGGGTCAGAQG